MDQIALGIFAHPDDAEMMCSGTLSLLQKKGWTVNIATMAPGDKGSAEYSREELSIIRKKEAEKSAKLIHSDYFCLDFEDVYILYNRESINSVTELIRKVKPAIVFTASSSDYMVDHEMTSLIVQTACFCCGIKNLEIASEIYEPVPFLYYSDAMEGKDKMGNDLQPSVYVDITSEMTIKREMLACHESQRSWLMTHHKIDEYLISMENFAARRGREINRKFAEGFRQHLGHGYPQDNILVSILGNLVVTR